MTVARRADVDRIPPSNLDAEMALLGSILVDKEIMPTVCELVHGDDFYAAFHETIYRALCSLFERGTPLDKVTLAEELLHRDLLDKVGGLAYLTSLMDAVPTAASAEYYARIVAEKAQLRRLIHAGTQVVQIGYEAEEDVAAGVDRAEQIVFDASRHGARRDGGPVADSLVGTYKQIEQRYYHKGELLGLTSGFPDIDEYTAGLQPGNLVIVAARPAMGKTSWALTMALAAARARKEQVAFFSLEMTKEELVERMMCSEARLDSNELRHGRIKDHEWEQLSEAIASLHELPLWLDDSSDLTATEIRSRCRRVKARGGLSCVIIDYVQLVRPNPMSRDATRNEQLGEILRVFKATAKDLRVPIVLLAQLNRDIEKRPKKRPLLADLRDSGNLEQEADVVAFLHRNSYYDPDIVDDADVTEFIIAKQRNGPTGTVKLRFLDACTRYVSYGAEERYSPAGA